MTKERHQHAARTKSRFASQKAVRNCVYQADRVTVRNRVRMREIMAGDISGNARLER